MIQPERMGEQFTGGGLADARGAGKDGQKSLRQADVEIQNVIARIIHAVFLEEAHQSVKHRFIGFRVLPAQLRVTVDMRLTDGNTLLIRLVIRHRGREHFRDLILQNEFADLLQRALGLFPEGFQQRGGLRLDDIELRPRLIQFILLFFVLRTQLPNLARETVHFFVLEEIRFFAAVIRETFFGGFAGGSEAFFLFLGVKQLLRLHILNQVLQIFLLLVEFALAVLNRVIQNALP